MPLLDYTTTVPVSRTVAQVQAKLVEHGARAVMMEYDDRGRITALAFKVNMPNGELPIRLPIDAVATFRVLQRQADNREIPGRFAREEHGMVFVVIKGAYCYTCSERSRTTEKGGKINARRIVSCMSG